MDGKIIDRQYISDDLIVDGSYCHQNTIEFGIDKDFLLGCYEKQYDVGVLMNSVKLGIALSK